MSTAALSKNVSPAIESIHVTDSTITAQLQDGRAISVPLSWSYRLELATPEQRANYEVFGAGKYVHWPDVDEDLSGTSFFNGTPPPDPGAQPCLGAQPWPTAQPCPRGRHYLRAMHQCSQLHSEIRAACG